MEYISVKELAKYIGMSTRVIQKWCVTGKVLFHTVHGTRSRGGITYEILVSSLPVEIQKKIADKSALELGVDANCNTSPHPNPLPQGEGVTKSPLEIGVNAGGYQFAEAQKETDVPTAAQATAQGSLVEKTGGVYPGSISGFIINSNNAGFSLKNETNVIINKESCALTEEQAQTLISFGLLSKEKEVKSATEIQKKKALAWVDLLALWQEYRMPKASSIPEFNEKCDGDLLKKDKSADMARVDSEFVELFNGGGIYPELYKQIGKISRPTLYRKAKIYKENKKDFYALIPDYGTNNKFRSKLSLIERYYLLKIMLHQNCYTLGRAYEIINRILAKEGIKICSYSAYKRA